MPYMGGYVYSPYGYAYTPYSSGSSGSSSSGGGSGGEQPGLELHGGLWYRRRAAPDSPARAAKKVKVELEHGLFADRTGQQQRAAGPVKITKTMAHALHLITDRAAKLKKQRQEEQKAHTKAKMKKAVRNVNPAVLGEVKRIHNKNKKEKESSTFTKNIPDPKKLFKTIQANIMKVRFFGTCTTLTVYCNYQFFDPKAGWCTR